MSELTQKGCVIKRESLLEDIFELADLDFAGVNGNEFTSKKALKAGFKSDLEYHVDKILKEEPNIEKVVEKVLSENYRDSYYEGFSIFTHSLNDNEVIAVVSYME